MGELAFGHPFPGAALTAGFWQERGRDTDGSPIYHRAHDYADGRFRSPIVAAADGVVVFDGWSGDKTAQFPLGMGGLCLAIEHADGWVTWYCHLDQTVVSVGDAVDKGQHVAHCGNTGYSTGPHLHFELQRPPRHQVDPAPYLEAGALPIPGLDPAAFNELFLDGYSAAMQSIVARVDELAAPADPADEAARAYNAGYRAFLQSIRARAVELGGG